MKDGDVGYKVVHNEDRRGCSFWFRYDTPECSFSNKDDEKYVRHYIKGATVKAHRRTLGLFVFESKEKAESFRFGEMLGSSHLLEVLRVRVRGKPKPVTVIPTIHDRCALYEVPKKEWVRLLLKGEGYRRGEIEYRSAPKGTFVVPAVEVLT